VKRFAESEAEMFGELKSIGKVTLEERLAGVGSIAVVDMVGSSRYVTLVLVSFPIDERFPTVLV